MVERGAGEPIKIQNVYMTANGRAAFFSQPIKRSKTVLKRMRRGRLLPYMHTYIQTCIYTSSTDPGCWTTAYIQTHIHTQYIHTHIHAQIHTYIHTHIHTHQQH